MIMDGGLPSGSHAQTMKRICIPKGNRCEVRYRRIENSYPLEECLQLLLL